MLATLLRRMARHPARLAVGLTVLATLLLAALAPVATTVERSTPTGPGAVRAGQDDAQADAGLRLASATSDPADAPPPRRCRGRVALTFDDGPTTRTTRRLVRSLVRLDVPATFFVVGQRVQAHRGLLQRMQRAGFVIGNHSWAHEQLTARSNRQVLRSLRATKRALRRAGVRPTPLMRPPYGAVNPRVRGLVRRAGLVPVLWTIDSEDWSHGNADQIARRILRSLRRGDNIVLQHDGVNRSPISVRAVATVVRVARQRGFCFTDLDDRGRLRRPGSLRLRAETPAAPVDPAVGAAEPAAEPAVEPAVDPAAEAVPHAPVPLTAWITGFRYWA